MGGGDIVTMFKDTPASRALMTYLATPAAATVWAKRGGFSSPNKNVKLTAYSGRRCSVGRRPRSQMRTIFRFDMSDLQPAAFGGTPVRASGSCSRTSCRTRRT